MLLAACQSNGAAPTPTEIPLPPTVTAVASSHSADQVLVAIRTQRSDVGCGKQDLIAGQVGPIFGQGVWFYSCAYWFGPGAPAAVAGLYTCVIVRDATLEILDDESMNLRSGTDWKTQVQPARSQCESAASRAIGSR